MTTDYEDMKAAEASCVPCKLCGEPAVIQDAGCGAGYYISCSGGKSFRKSGSCMISSQRLGGSAKNVANWWNRLHGEKP